VACFEPIRNYFCLCRPYKSFPLSVNYLFHVRNLYLCSSNLLKFRVVVCCGAYGPDLARKYYEWCYTWEYLWGKAPERRPGSSFQKEANQNGVLEHFPGIGITNTSSFQPNCVSPCVPELFFRKIALVLYLDVRQWIVFLGVSGPMKAPYRFQHVGKISCSSRLIYGHSVAQSSLIIWNIFINIYSTWKLSVKVNCSAE
jgi:hypothetical protein